MTEYTQCAAQIRWIRRMGAEARQVVQAMVGAARKLALGVEERRGESVAIVAPLHGINVELILLTADTRERRNVDVLAVQL